MANTTDTIFHRWFEEVWNKGREEAIDELMDENAVVHGLGEEIRGPSAFKPFYRKFRAAFPDMRITVEEAVVDGDMIAVRCVVTCTHTGPGVLPTVTGKSARFSGMCMGRVKNGKICDGWNTFDFMSLYEQLGLRLT